jgi:Fe-S oxidoreductase
MGGYDPKGREIVADFARIMNFLGTSYGVLRKEKCTGDPVRRLGNDLLFQQLAEANLEALAQNKVKKIVTICPHCVRTIQEDWKEYGTPPEVEHHSEFLARFAHKLPGVVSPSLINPAENPSEQQLVSGHDFSRAENSLISARALAPELNPSRVPQVQGPRGEAFVRGAEVPPLGPGKEKIVFHDPCYLGRYRDVYEEPRTVAALSGELVEAPRNHERSFCCGAGGGLSFLGEETGERVSHVRTAELTATGAQTIATACPFCNSMFRDALATTGDATTQLLDIAQLAARGLPKE